MRSGMIDLQKVLDELVDTDVVGLPDEDVRTALPQLLTAFNQLSALIAGVVASFDTRDLSQVDGCKTTTAWLVAFGRMTPTAASGWLTRGRLLRELPALNTAATHGEASTEHITRIAELTRRLDTPTVKEFDTILADLAATARPSDVSKACDRIAAHKDPDGKPPDPERDFERREFSISRRGSMFALRGQLDLEGGATLITAIDALLKPPPPTDLRTAPQRRADALIELARLEHHRQPATHRRRHPPQPRHPHHPRDPARHPHPPHRVRGHRQATDHHRRPTRPTPAKPGRALRLSKNRPNTTRPTTIHHRSDTTNSPSPATDQSPADARTGSPPPASPNHPRPPGSTGPARSPPPWPNVSPATATYGDACSTRPPDSPSKSAAPTASSPTGCAKPCTPETAAAAGPAATRPVSWTDAHHLIFWFLGGRTDIDQLVCLCRWHHVKVHEGQWTIRLDPATGEVHVTRPDGTPYELGPSQPHTTPTRTRAA